MWLAIRWMRLVPYPQSADRIIRARLAEVVEQTATTWIVVDDHGERHELDIATHQELVADAAAPRWVAQGPVPAAMPGDRVLMRWSTRSAPPSWPCPDDITGTVVGGDGETVIVEDEHGVTRSHWRGNGHEQIARGEDRNRLRWVIVGPPEPAP